MNKKMYQVTEPKQESNIVYHEDSYEATMRNKPYIIPASKAGTYSKLDKAQKKEEKKLKKELKDYTKYDL